MNSDTEKKSFHLVWYMGDLWIWETRFEQPNKFYVERRLTENYKHYTNGEHIIVTTSWNIDYLLERAVLEVI